MDEVEQSMAVILAKNHGSFSAMARRGYSKNGRGAVFVWESEGQKPFATYRSSYLPQSDRAFLKAGPHPVEMTRAYDPASEFVAVFVGADEDIHTVRVDLVDESQESQFEV
jgi:hypothetical protein